MKFYAEFKLFAAEYDMLTSIKSANRRKRFTEETMTHLFTAKETKELEKLTFERGISYLQMMENAGRACCEAIHGEWGAAGKRVTLLCGKGGNGGDGFVLARHLLLRGAFPLVVQIAPAAQNDAVEMFGRLGNIPVIGLPEESAAKKLFAESDIIVDAVYGIGMHGTLPDAVRALLEQANESPAHRVAVDIPSGVCADDGSVAEGAFQAELTIALGCYKPAHFSLPGNGYCGKILLRSFGEDAEDRVKIKTAAFTMATKEAFELLPPRRAAGNKGTFGMVLNLAGSRGMSGAAALSTKAALRSGAGLVKLATAKSLIPVIASGLYEPVMLGLEESENGQMLWDERLDEALLKAAVCAVGCGIGSGKAGCELMAHLLHTRTCQLVIDADGINCMAQAAELKEHIGPGALLTPHPLEFSRLMGKSVAEVQRNRIAAAREAAKELGTVVLLKGSSTVIAHPDGRLYLNTTGNSGLAKGGSGDVLTGMIAGFAAQGMSLFRAAIAGACLHGAAADLLAMERSEYSILPSDLIETLPQLLKQLEK